MYYIRKIVFVIAFILIGATSVYGAELPPVADTAIKHSAKIKITGILFRLWQSIFCLVRKFI